MGLLWKILFNGSLVLFSLEQFFFTKVKFVSRTEEAIHRFKFFITNT